jgi:hypothetical protein
MILLSVVMFLFVIMIMRVFRVGHCGAARKSEYDHD